MFEMGDVVLLPPGFGNEKKGVLARKEDNEVWLVQIGTSGYQFIPEKDLRPFTRVTNCRHCGAQWKPHVPISFDCSANSYKCPVCGACNCKK